AEKTVRGDVTRLALRKDARGDARDAAYRQDERVVLDPGKRVRSGCHTEDPFLGFVSDDAGDCQDFLWPELLKPADQGVRDLVTDRGGDRDVGHNRRDIHTADVLCIDTHGIVDESLVHHCEGREVPGGHRPDLFEPELVYHVLERDGTDKAAAREAHEDCTVCGKWFRKDIEVPVRLDSREVLMDHIQPGEDLIVSFRSICRH